MSYDLMVFDAEAAPGARQPFLTWFEQQTEWSEDHGYDDPAVSSPRLRAWFLEMIQRFPAMNGPYASDDVDDPSVTDYSVGRSVIYISFAWSEAEKAYEATSSLARRHGLGFFDVSGEGTVWIPAGDDYRPMHEA